MEGEHVRPFREVNLVAAKPEPLTMETAAHLVAVLRRKCGDDATAPQLAPVLRDVLAATVAVSGKTRKLSLEAQAKRKAQLLTLALQLVLPVRYVQLSAAALTALESSFHPAADNAPMLRSLLAPLALSKALCEALLRQKVVWAAGHDSVHNAALLAVAAGVSPEDGTCPDDIRVALMQLLATLLPSMITTLLGQEPTRPPAAELFNSIGSAVTAGLHINSLHPVVLPRVAALSTDTLADLLLWAEQRTTAAAKLAASKRPGTAAKDAAAYKIAHGMMYRLMYATCRLTFSQRRFSPNAARKLLKLFSLLLGRIAHPASDRAKPAALMYHAHSLMSTACGSLSRPEELKQLEAFAAVGVEVLAATPERLTDAGLADCIAALTGILRAVAIYDTSAYPIYRDTPGHIRPQMAPAGACGGHGGVAGAPDCAARGMARAHRPGQVPHRV